MGWHDLIAFTEMPQGLFQRNDDDMYDRLSHRWTAAQLIGFALLVTTTTYVGDPIKCWVPAHFEKSWEKYTNTYCWIRNTYYLPFESDISPLQRQENKHPILYYQWVAMILLIQALLFFLPIILWRNLNNKTGMDMNDIIETTERLPHIMDREHKNKLLSFLAQATHRYLNQAKPRTKVNGFSIRCIYNHIFGLCGKKYGNYITVLYVVIKFMFLVNVVGQLWLLNFMLGHQHSSYGIDVAMSMWKGEDWTESERFPRVTMCDLDVRRLGNHNMYTVQCVLAVNFFNEKIFLYLWWWFVIVAIFTLIGFILLLIRTIFKCDQHAYIETHLRKTSHHYDRRKEQDRKLMDDFVYDYLRSDGVLLARLVGHNTTKATATEFIGACFEHYLELPSVKTKLGNYKPGYESNSLLPSLDTSFDSTAE